ncbi:MAG: glycosyltransferase, partial [Dehalococcoidia bacterium]
MKILLISSTFPPRKFGGVTESSYILAKYLAQKGHDVTVYTTDVNDRYSRIPDTKGVKNMDGIKVHYFKNLSNWLASRRLFLPLGMVPAIRRELKRFDIIHLNEFRSFHSIVVHHYAKKYGIPYVLQARGSLPRVVSKQNSKQIYDIFWGYKLLRDASRVIALSQMEAEQYKDMGISQDKIEVVPNGINLAEFDDLPPRGEFRTKWGVNSSQKVVLFLSRINEIKGPDLLVEAFATASNELDNVKLIIAGPDDGYLPVLKRLINELKITDKVLFTGLLYGRDKLEAYIDADVYVL